MAMRVSRPANLAVVAVGVLCGTAILFSALHGLQNYSLYQLENERGLDQSQLAQLCHVPPAWRDDATVVESYVTNRNQKKVCQSGWMVYKDLLNSKPENAVVHPGVPTSSFNRSVPLTLDPALPMIMNRTLNILQNFSGAPGALNTFTCPQKNLFVAELADCYVEGPAGLIFDINGNIFHDNDHFFSRLEVKPFPLEEPMEVKEFPMLISVVQKYSNMYYHFTVEILPRIISARSYLDTHPEAKLLIWDSPFIRNYLQMMGIPFDRIEPFSPNVRYFAKVLIYPAPVPRITPCRESMMATREMLNVTVLPEAERDVVIYLSRKNEMNRRIENEEELLEDLKKQLPNEKIVVYDGNPNIDEVIDLFQRAKMVIGPHGAGFSHIIFTAPGTKIVEMLFVKDPPMMFWHISGALDLKYYMVPLPGTYWTLQTMTAPVPEITSLVYKALGMSGNQESASILSCAHGEGMIMDDEAAAVVCEQCPPGSFASNTGVCEPCASGEVAKAGSGYCEMCPQNSYEEENMYCNPCRDGLSTFVAGSSGAETCISQQEIDTLLQNIFSLMVQSGFLKKLEPEDKIRNPLSKKYGRSADPYMMVTPTPAPMPAMMDSPPAFEPPAPSLAMPTPTPSAATPAPTPSAATPAPAPSAATPAPTPSAATPTPTPSAATPVPVPAPSPSIVGTPETIFADTLNPFYTLDGSFGFSPELTVGDPSVFGFVEGPFEGSASLIAVAGPSSALIFTRLEGKIPANVQGSFWILAGNALVPEELIFEISDSDRPEDPPVLSVPLPMLADEEIIFTSGWVQVSFSGPADLVNTPVDTFSINRDFVIAFPFSLDLFTITFS